MEQMRVKRALPLPSGGKASSGPQDFFVSRRHSQCALRKRIERALQPDTDISGQGVVLHAAGAAIAPTLKLGPWLERARCEVMRATFGITRKWPCGLFSESRHRMPGCSKPIEFRLAVPCALYPQATCERRGRGTARRISKPFEHVLTLSRLVPVPSTSTHPTIEVRPPRASLRVAHVRA